MTTWILLITLSTITNAQFIDIQDLTNNHGYIPIKIKDVKIIDKYIKIIHVINTTQYLETANILQENIHKLANTYTNISPLLDSVNKSMDICKTKIKNLTPKFRQKRGLVNAIGKGLKYVTGTMDSDDEKEIFNKINTLVKNNRDTMTALDEISYLSTSMSDKIFNITNHINNQQKIVQKYVNKFKTEVQNKILDLEDETIFLQNVFQINNDVNLLMDHINEIGLVIFNSKLGIIPSDILTKEEYNFIDGIESYLQTKVSLTYRENFVILTLSVPRFLNESFSEVIFEPLPNNENKTLILNQNTVLIYKNETYKSNTLEYKNLEKINDNCLTDIIQNVEPKCNMNITKNQEEREIFPGLLIFKHYQDKIETNCKNPYKLENFKTYLLKFENCIVKTQLRTYENYKINVKEMFILEKFILKIKESNSSFNDLDIKEIHFNETIKIVKHKLLKTTLIHTGSSIGIFIILIALFIIMYFRTQKTKTYIVSSSEPHSNEGGVIITPNKIII